MNRKVLALLVPALLVAGAANAAEVYNKNGNKLDLYGKVDGLRYFSDNAGDDGDQSYARIGFKGETQINDMLTGYGQWEYNMQASGTEGNRDTSWTRLGFAGLKFGEYGSFDYGRNYGVIYDVEAWTDVLPEFGGDSYTTSSAWWKAGTSRCNTRVITKVAITDLARKAPVMELTAVQIKKTVTVSASLPLMTLTSG
ncbi:putative porin [Salmonella enterica subsp. enterica serovar Montevideo str. S5-403]|uniref:Putative porin n=1 Tax=Salmonella enterica subsp. enterica serovar Montevideo str. S5-403 TaxID=913242 RepID=G5Q117_SALMO|nr:putative porin [Salmonella enterica subsp. enterica serovar Montevideo str. S5-403]